MVITSNEQEGRPGWAPRLRPTPRPATSPSRAPVSTVPVQPSSVRARVQALERQNGARPEAPRNRRRDGLVLPEGSEGLLRHEAMLRDRQREERQGSAGTVPSVQLPHASTREAPREASSRRHRSIRNCVRGRMSFFTRRDSAPRHSSPRPQISSPTNGARIRRTNSSSTPIVSDLPSAPPTTTSLAYSASVYSQDDGGAAEQADGFRLSIHRVPTPSPEEVRREFGRFSHISADTNGGMLSGSTLVGSRSISVQSLPSNPDSGNHLVDFHHNLPSDPHNLNVSRIVQGLRSPSVYEDTIEGSDEPVRYSTVPEVPALPTSIPEGRFSSSVYAPIRSNPFSPSRRGSNREREGDEAASVDGISGVIRDVGDVPNDFTGRWSTGSITPSSAGIADTGSRLSTSPRLPRNDAENIADNGDHPPRWATPQPPNEMNNNRNARILSPHEFDSGPSLPPTTLYTHRDTGSRFLEHMDAPVGAPYDQPQVSTFSSDSTERARLLPSRAPPHRFYGRDTGPAGPTPGPAGPSGQNQWLGYLDRGLTTCRNVLRKADVTVAETGRTLLRPVSRTLTTMRRSSAPPRPLHPELAGYRRNERRNGVVIDRDDLPELVPTPDENRMDNVAKRLWRKVSRRKK